MNGSFKDYIIDKADVLTLPQVKHFYRQNKRRPQAAKIDEVYVLKYQHKLLAALRLCPQDNVWLLRSMCVEADYRGQGIGTYLLKKLQPVLLEKQCYCFPYVYLQMFYHNAGFTMADMDSVPSGLKESYHRYIGNGRKIILMKHQPLAGTR